MNNHETRTLCMGQRETCASKQRNILCAITVIHTRVYSIYLSIAAIYYSRVAYGMCVHGMEELSMNPYTECRILIFLMKSVIAALALCMAVAIFVYIELFGL